MPPPTTPSTPSNPRSERGSNQSPGRQAPPGPPRKRKAKYSLDFTLLKDSKLHHIRENNPSVMLVSELLGVPVKPHSRKAGDYVLGPKLGCSPVKCIVSCLARKENTGDYYVIKMLTLSGIFQSNQSDRDITPNCHKKPLSHRRQRNNRREERENVATH